MKVICVNTDFEPASDIYSCKWTSFSESLMLTIGKWYQVDAVGSDYYTVIVNKGYRANLSKSYFKTVEELREDKLAEIGF